MKSFISAVSTACAVLFLAVSLSGCLDGEKTASQSVGSGFFSSNGVGIPIPKFNQEKVIGLYFWGPSISTDPEIERFRQEVWGSLGHGLRKESWTSDQVAMYITTNGGTEILIPYSIVKKLHQYTLAINAGGSNAKDYAVWKDGMNEPFIFPLV